MGNERTGRDGMIARTNLLSNQYASFSEPSRQIVVIDSEAGEEHLMLLRRRCPLYAQRYALTRSFPRTGRTLSVACASVVVWPPLRTRVQNTVLYRLLMCAVTRERSIVS